MIRLYTSEALLFHIIKRRKITPLVGDSRFLFRYWVLKFRRL